MQCDTDSLGPLSPDLQHASNYLQCELSSGSFWQSQTAYLQHIHEHVILEVLQVYLQFTSGHFKEAWNLQFSLFCVVFWCHLSFNRIILSWTVTSNAAFCVRRKTLTDLPDCCRDHGCTTRMSQKYSLPCSLSFSVFHIKRLRTSVFGFTKRRPYKPNDFLKTKLYIWGQQGLSGTLDRAQCCKNILLFDVTCIT